MGPERRDPRDDSLAEPLLGSDTNITSTSNGRAIGDEYEEPVVDDPQQAENPPLSRNIRLVLIYTVFAFAGRSLWSQSVLATYVFLLTNNNAEAVGFITAAMGLAQLLASFPSGVLADRYRRDSILRVASVAGCAAIGMTVFSVYQESYIYLVASLSAWGVVWGIANTSLSALFADSKDLTELSS